MNIAILGATSHIAKGLMYNWAKENGFFLGLYARNKVKVKEFLEENNIDINAQIIDISAFPKASYDVIINCVGFGRPQSLKENMPEIFFITEKYDNLIIDYLREHPKSLYVNFSSGASYGTDFVSPAGDFTFSKWSVNNVSVSDYYGIAKFNSEAKHRALFGFNIVDLRIFGYFSKFMKLDSGYLLSDIILCVKNKKDFITNDKDIIRDYIHPEDLSSLVRRCIEKKNFNDSFDVYSKKPVKKNEILKYFKTHYGLICLVNKSAEVESVTGIKSRYYSKSKKAEKIVGYYPKYSSLECIEQEAGVFLKIKGSRR